MLGRPRRSPLPQPGRTPEQHIEATGPGGRTAIDTNLVSQLLGEPPERLGVLTSIGKLVHLPQQLSDGQLVGGLSYEPERGDVPCQAPIVDAPNPHTGWCRGANAGGEPRGGPPAL